MIPFFRRRPAITPLQQARQALDKTLAELDRLEPNRFGRLLAQEPRLPEQYLLICQLGYAAESKELRDTDDPRVQACLDGISGRVRAIGALVRLVIVPADKQQAAAWQAACGRVPNGQHLMKKDGSIDIFLLTAAIGHDDCLHVQRVWSDVGNYDGVAVTLTLPLGEAQAAAVRRRLESLRDE